MELLKETYTAPTSVVVDLLEEGIVCASPPGFGGGGGFTYP